MVVFKLLVILKDYKQDADGTPSYTHTLHLRQDQKHGTGDSTVYYIETIITLTLDNMAATAARLLHRCAGRNASRSTCGIDIEKMDF